MEEWTKRTEEVVREQKTNPSRGLSEREADERLKQVGENVLETGKKPPSLLCRFLGQLNDALVLLLLAAAGISLLLSLSEGKLPWDTVIIVAIVLLNAIIGVVQECRAQKAMDALKALHTPEAKVLREGEIRQIDAKGLVPGDILVLETGDQVAADGRLLESVSLKMKEAALTGEAEEVEKEAKAICGPHTPLAEQKNMVFASSFVAYGHGLAVVTATGMQTQVGHMAHLMNQEGEKKTPLQQKLAKTGQVLAFGALGICVLIFLLGLLRGGDLFALFLTSVSLAVAAIPEGLTAVVTIVLAMGTGRLAQKNAVVRRLMAVETLGSATVICSDKTGTLTQNNMQPVAFVDAGGKALTEGDKRQLLHRAALCNHARLVDGTFFGMATEKALASYAYDSHCYPTQREREMVDEVPFSSERKKMTSLHRLPDGRYLWVMKGAPEVVVPCCRFRKENGAERPLLPSEKERALAAAAALAEKALRVIAVCEQSSSQKPPKGRMEENMVLLGFVGLMDPPRPEARNAVLCCKEAGIRPVMITGDNVKTAVAIAKEVGIFQEGDGCLTGPKLSQMSDEQLQKEVEHVSVYARVSPEHKVRIVKAWQKKGHVVAMTGDGANDAPALKAADIGCAMGKTGTDAAKNASDLVITDDHFATIVSAVREGRNLFGNIRKTVHFLLSSNIGEIVTIFVAMCFAWPVPLLPIQLLWVNLLTDSLPAIALGLDKGEADIMRHRLKETAVLSRSDGWRILLEGLMIGFLALTAFGLGQRSGNLTVGRTMAFSVLAISQLVHAFNMRKEETVLQKGMLENRWLDLAFLVGVGLQAMVVVCKPLQHIFGVTTLTTAQWGMVFGLSFLPLLVVEGEKRALSFRK